MVDGAPRREPTGKVGRGVGGPRFVVPAAPAERRRRGWLARLLLLGGALLVALGLTELGFRWLWNPPVLAELGLKGLYRNEEPGQIGLQPGFCGTLRVGGDAAPTAVRVNALGLRGPELGPKATGELRVLCAGDSVVFGYGVEEGEAFAARLAPLLGERLGRAVVSGNAGVPGYGVRAGAEQVARMVPRISADAVVLGVFLGNDFEDDQKHDYAVAAGLMFEGPWARLVQRSLRARVMLHSRAWLYVEMQLWLGGSGLALQPLPTAADVAGFDGFPNRAGPPLQCHAGLFLDVTDEGRRWSGAGPPVLPRLMAGLRQHLAAAQAAAAGRPLLVVVLPTLWHCEPRLHAERLAGMQLEPGEYTFGRAQERILGVCRELGLPALDGTPVLRAAGAPESLFLADGGHLSPRGHEVMAGALAAKLAELLATPAAKPTPR